MIKTALLALTLAWCSHLPLKQTHQRNEYTSRIVFDTAKKINDICHKATWDSTAIACATWYDEEKLCIKYVPIIEDLWDTEGIYRLWHEDLHCIYGNFHN